MKSNLAFENQIIQSENRNSVEQPTWLWVLWGESPLSLIVRIRTTSISDVHEGNDMSSARMETPPAAAENLESQR